MKSTFPPIIRLTGRAVPSLASYIHGKSSCELEAVRVARAGYALLTSGCSIHSPVFLSEMTSSIVSRQQIDGGWHDIEETLWCLGYLNAFGEKYDTELANGRKWLTSVQLPCGAWGKSERDQPRIPITALATALVPEAVDRSALKWLANQWEEDLVSPTQLTYKGAFYLLAQAHSKGYQDDELVIRTINYLAGEQDEDGGFGPWKGHPVGSDPWSTGVVLWGLSRVGELAPRQVIERALSWLKSKQLSNGFWPYHYLDDGTAVALIGISSVLPILAE